MCPRTAEQVEQIRDERRRALLRAARIVFARKGFAAAKISDVAAEAGISHGLVYHYFPEKESLFAATVEEAMQGWQGLVTLARKQPGEPWDRLVYLCTEMITGLREAPEYLLVLVHANTEDATPSAVRDLFRRHQRQTLADIAAMIEEGQRAGQVAPGAPVELTLALIAIVQGLAINRLVDPGGSLPPLDVVLRILRP